MLLLDYTNKKVVGIAEYHKLLDKEIHRVKSHTGDKSKLLVISKKDNHISRNDSLSILSSIGPTISFHLSEAEIEIVGDLLSTNTKLYYASQYL